jgi:hypothetical protein
MFTRNLTAATQQGIQAIGSIESENRCQAALNRPLSNARSWPRGHVRDAGRQLLLGNQAIFAHTAGGLCLELSVPAKRGSEPKATN